MTNLIALSSPAPQSGKSTVAAILSQHGYKTEKFAAPLKAMLCEIYQCSPEKLEKDKGEPKEVKLVWVDALTIACYTGIPLADLVPLTVGRVVHSIREAHQTIGADVIRAIDPDWHVNQLLVRLNPDVPTCVDDCRMENEAEAIRQRGGILIRVGRPGLAHDPHPSETAMRQYFCDYTIVNDGTLSDLNNKVESLIDFLKSYASP